jgi:hypothetical protein
MTADNTNLSHFENVLSVNGTDLLTAVHEEEIGAVKDSQQSQKGRMM